MDSLSCPYSPRHGSFPQDDSSPRVTLFFPHAPPPFFARGRRRSIAASFSCSDTRLPRADVAGLDQAATSFGDLEALLAKALGPGCCGATWDCCLDRISTTWTKRRRGLTRWTRPRDARELAATGEGIARDERRNCARKRKRPCDARENFPRRWKIPGQK